MQWWIYVVAGVGGLCCILAMIGIVVVIIAKSKKPTTTRADASAASSTRDDGIYESFHAVDNGYDAVPVPINNDHYGSPPEVCFFTTNLLPLLILLCRTGFVESLYTTWTIITL
jgi:hypothetical protein